MVVVETVSVFSRNLSSWYTETLGKWTRSFEHLPAKKYFGMVVAFDSRSGKRSSSFGNPRIEFANLGHKQLCSGSRAPLLRISLTELRHAVSLQIARQAHTQTSHDIEE